MTNLIIGSYVGGPVSGDYGAVFMDGRELTPDESLAVVNHSPTGFAWGYLGSGPAQLAMAVLLRAGVRPGHALLCYQDFKVQHIAPQPHGPFALELDVARWASDWRRAHHIRLHEEWKVDLVRVPCSCGWTGVWYSDEDVAYRAHARHVEQANCLTCRTGAVHLHPMPLSDTCNHDWQEQEGEPPVDVCSQCGAVRE